MSKKISKRIDWIDVLKGLGMFFVIWGHCLPNNKYRIRKYILSFHMPLFFFASGLTCHKDLNLDFKTFLKKKIKSLLIPYFIINFIGIIIFGILFKVGVVEEFNLLESIIGVFYSHNKVFKAPIGQLWFVTALFLTQILFYFINKISKNDKDIFILCLICAIIGYVNSISTYQIYGPWHIEAVFTAVMFYFLGYIFTKNIKIYDKYTKNKLCNFILGFILFVVAVAVQYKNQAISMYVGNYGSIILFYISSLSSILGLIIFVNLFLKKSYIFKTIGKYSIFFLCYHYSLILIFKKYFDFFKSGNINLLLLSIIVTVILFPLSIITYNKLPIFHGKSQFLERKLDYDRKKEN